MTQPRAIVLGDAMLDVWVDLENIKVNPEDPSTNVVQHKQTRVMPGGALNVARNLCAAGLDTTFLNVVPLQPLEHERLYALVKKYPDLRVISPISPMNGGHLLTRKKRVRHHGKLLYREDTDQYPSHTLSCDNVMTVLDQIIPHVIVCVDYHKGALPPIIYSLLKIAQNRTQFGRIFLDLKPDLLHFLAFNTPDLLANTIIKCNEHEWKIAGVTLDVVSWVSTLNIFALYITRANGGVTSVSQYGKSEHRLDYPTFSPNVCGAGDVFLAALVRSIRDTPFARHASGAEATDVATRAVHSGQRETLVGDWSEFE